MTQMELTDRALAQFQLAIYGGQAAAWDSLHYSDVVWGEAKFGGVTAIVFRGSTCYGDDWLHDGNVLIDPVKGLGAVHRGFFYGMVDAWKAIKASTSEPRIVVGHSLGAARATIAAGLMKLDGHPPIARVCWGEPSSGLADFARLIGDIPARSYRNRCGDDVDPVTQLLLFYRHASPLIDVALAGKPDGFVETMFERLLPCGWLHNMGLYAEHTPL